MRLLGQLVFVLAVAATAVWWAGHAAENGTELSDVAVPDYPPAERMPRVQLRQPAAHHRLIRVSFGHGPSATGDEHAVLTGSEPQQRG